MKKTILPYGRWNSPFSAASVAAGGIRLREPLWDGKTLYWLEGRPQESGRTAIVCRKYDGTIQDLIPAPFNARTQVHEYGGGSYWVDGNTVYFSNFSDNRLYRLSHGKMDPLTPESLWRYADFQKHPLSPYLVSVVEDHTHSSLNPKNFLACVSTSGNTAPISIAQGCDFYSNPRFSRDGKKLAWLCWNHPYLPWNFTELWVADVSVDGTLKNNQKITGGANESILQPEWTPEGTLLFLSDRDTWWNLYEFANNKIEQLTHEKKELGGPLWVFGESFFALWQDKIVLTYVDQGVNYLAHLDRKTLKLEKLNLPFTDFAYLRVSGDDLAFVGGSPQKPTAIVQYQISTGLVEELRRSVDEQIDTELISVPQTVSFHNRRGQEVFAFYYPPRNPLFDGKADERPPLLVSCHGGPTAATQPVLSFETQFFTSRGFAVINVNYSGSTGYGREYRDRLAGECGVIDVEDCVDAALWLAEQGKADKNRLLIHGGSAGGYITLCAITFHDVFAAAASYFGIADMEMMAQDSHKFESKYDQWLIGPYPAAKETYRARAPLHHVDRLKTPLLILQGLDDKVVPPNQGEKLFDALKKKGILVKYLPFEGEGHGFRKAENIQRALETELAFYLEALGIQG